MTDKKTTQRRQGLHYRMEYVIGQICHFSVNSEIQGDPYKYAKTKNIFYKGSIKIPNRIFSVVTLCF